MILHLERLTDIQDGRYDTAMALYAESFPPHEQRQIASQEAILRDKRYRFELVFDGVEWVGLLLCWETKDFIYVEHFCIFPELRNRHYGQRTLSLLQQSGKTIVLEIDPQRTGFPVAALVSMRAADIAPIRIRMYTRHIMWKTADTDWSCCPFRKR